MNLRKPDSEGLTPIHYIMIICSVCGPIALIISLLALLIAITK